MAFSLLPSSFFLEGRGLALLFSLSKEGGVATFLLLKRKGDPPSPLKGMKRKRHPSSLFFLLLRREGGLPSLFSLEGKEEWILHRREGG